MILDRRDARDAVMAKLRESEKQPNSAMRWELQVMLLRELEALVRADREEREAAE